MVCLMLLYGWACIPLMYPLNYVFKVPSTAFVVSSSFNVFCGVVTTMTTSVLDELGQDEVDLMKINSVLKIVFLILFPHYCLGQGFLQMATLYTVASVKRSYGYTVNYNPFEFNQVGQNLLALTCQGAVYFTINLLIQYNFFIHFKPTSDVSKLSLGKDDEDEDDDVRNERIRVLKNEEQSKRSMFDGVKAKFNAFKHKTGVAKSQVSSPDIINTNRLDSTSVDNDFKHPTTSATDYIRYI